MGDAGICKGDEQHIMRSSQQQLCTSTSLTATIRKSAEDVPLKQCMFAQGPSLPHLCTDGGYDNPRVGDP